MNASNQSKFGYRELSGTETSRWRWAVKTTFRSPWVYNVSLEIIDESLSLDLILGLALISTHALRLFHVRSGLSANPGLNSVSSTYAFKPRYDS